jgi:type III restriction enzyme
VVSPRFIEAAWGLKDALVQGNGFQKLEAADFVVPREGTWPLFPDGTLFAQASEFVHQEPDLSKLPVPLQSQVSYSKSSSLLTVTGALSHSEMETLQACFMSPEDRAAVERIYEKLRGHRVGVRASKVERPPLRVPWLAIRVDGQLEILDESYFKDIELRLVDYDASLSETEFPSEVRRGESGEVDVAATGKVEVRQFAEQVREQLSLVMGEPGWTVAGLVDWLDRQRSHIDIPQAQSAGYIGRLLTWLMENRGLSIEQLAREKFRLANAIWMKIDQLRQGEAVKGYNTLLFGPGSGKIEVSPKFYFEFDPERYAPNAYYDGPYQFNKHYCRRVGQLDGEEFECAQFLDTLPQVWHWLRNAVRSETSCWLQTSTDRFYPDFVVLLNDGRVMLVEYKNEKDWSNDDSKEKLRVGKLWEERSGGHCLFVMPKGKDWSTITAATGNSSMQSDGEKSLTF